MLGEGEDQVDVVIVDQNQVIVREVRLPANTPNLPAPNAQGQRIVTENDEFVRVEIVVVNENGEFVRLDSMRAGDPRLPAPDAQGRRIIAGAEAEEERLFAQPPQAQPPAAQPPETPEERAARLAREERRVRLWRELRAPVPAEAQPPAARPPDGAPCRWEIGQQIPRIGGPEWCRLMPAIQEQLARLGNAILDTIFSVLPPAEAAAGGDLNAVEEVALAAAVGPANLLIRLMLRSVPSAMATLRQLVDCWRQMARLSPQCQPGTLLGLVVTRAMVRLMRKFRVGTDAGLWATVDITMDLPQLDRALKYLIEAACPSVIPGAHEAWRAYSMRQIDEPTWRCWTLAAGEDPDLWRAVRETESAMLPYESIIQYARLQGTPQADVDATLYARGWTLNPDRAIIQWLYDRPATGEEYMQWHFAGALDRDVERILRRDTGLDEWWNGHPGQLARAGGMTHEVAQHSWRQQQPLPDYQDLQRYLYRCRDGNVAPQLVVTEDMVKTIISSRTMAPGEVDWAMATIYRAVEPCVAAVAVRVGIARPRMVEDALRDGGYAALDARDNGDAITMDQERKRAEVELGWTTDVAVAARRIGLTLTRSDRRALERQGLTDETITRAARVASIQFRSGVHMEGLKRAQGEAVEATLAAYRVGLVEAAEAAKNLTAIGYTARSALGILVAQDLGVKATRIGHATEQLRAAVMRGELTALQAGVILSQAGVTSGKQDELQSAWEVERAATRPMATVRDVRRWVQQGVMPLKTARTRLANLGWVNPDLTLQVSEMGAKLAAAQAAAQRKGAAAMKAAAAAADRIKQQALRRLEKSQPVAALGQWYKDGIIGETEVAARMRRYGYDTHSIELWIKAWDYQVKKAIAARDGAKPAARLTPMRQIPLSRVRAWYLDGIQSREWADDRLKQYGYADDARASYLEQWDQQRAARASKTHPPGPV